MFDWSLSLGNVLTLLTFIGGGWAFVWNMRSYMDKSIAILTLKMSLVDLQFTKVDQKLERFSDALMTLAKQDIRLTNYEVMLGAFGKRITELERRFNRKVDGPGHQTVDDGE